MQHPPEITSANAHRSYVHGSSIKIGEGPVWKDILVEVRSYPLVEKSFLVPAVAEPYIIWQISGTTFCEERETGGEWISHTSKPNDFFLTASTRPYELRWRSIDGEPNVCLAVYVGLPLLLKATREILGDGAELPALKEAHVGDDHVATFLLEQLRSELMDRSKPSKMLVQGAAQSLAVHLLRVYRDQSIAALPPARSVLPAFHFRKVQNVMEEHLNKGIQVTDLASTCNMSESHFSRIFKNTTGLSPMQFFIRLRMEKAQQLLRETVLSVIVVGAEVGYANAGHFSQVFKKETGQTPSDYRRAADSGKSSFFSRIAKL